MSERIVMVWDQACLVTLSRRSPSAWVAVGDYMGQRIETTDRSVSSALKRWREAAQQRRDRSTARRG